MTLRQAEAVAAIWSKKVSRCRSMSVCGTGHPYIAETLERMGRDGVKNAVGFILSAQQSEAGWERYKANVEEASERVGPLAPQVSFTVGWHDHPLFIQAVADLTNQAFLSLPADRRKAIPFVYTAHSVPTSIPSSREYVRQVEEGARLVTECIGHENWSVAYQSRSGPPQVPWLEPGYRRGAQGLAAQGARDAVVVPIGFVCDHIEVLYDLDTEARGIAARNGLNMIRARTVNAHPSFIQMIAEMVRATLNQ